jgi:peroxiredoxin Q/BCP
MRLTPGTPAPRFTKSDVRGDVLDMPSLIKEKPLWLGFFRYALCPLCNLRVHQMVGEWDRFKDRCHFIAIFQSPPDAFDTFLTEHTPPFGVIADPKLDLFASYALEKSFVGAVLHPKGFADGMKAMKAGFPSKLSDPHHGAALRIPGDFIIDKKGNLAVARYGGFISDSIPFDEADNVLSALR